MTTRIRRAVAATLELIPGIGVASTRNAPAMSDAGPGIVIEADGDMGWEAEDDFDRCIARFLAGDPDEQPARRWLLQP